MGTRTVQLHSRYILLEKQLVCVQSAVFLRSDSVATKFSMHVLVQLLFEGGVYFSGKPADINDELDQVHTSETVTNVRHCQ